MIKPSNKFNEWIEKECSKRGIDVKTIDIEAELDSTLSLTENKTHFRSILDTLGSDFEEQYKQAVEDNERFNAEEGQALQKKIKEHNKCVICAKPEIEKYYTKLSRAVKLVCSDKIHCCFIKGRAGIGKTVWIHKILEREGKEWVKFSGKITDAKLYEFLYKNNGKIIWFDDVGKLLRGLESLDMLKIVTDDKEVRVLSKSNYSKFQAPMPDSFEFKGGLIFSFNSLVKGDNWEDLQALFDRGIYVDLVFSYEDVCNVMKFIATAPVKKEITEFIIKNYKIMGANLFNFRLQDKCFKIYEYANESKLDWKKEILDEIQNQMSEIQRKVYTFTGDKWIKRSELVKFLVRTEMYSKRTCERRISDWIDLGEIYTDGRQKFSMIGIRPIAIENG